MVGGGKMEKYKKAVYLLLLCAMGAVLLFLFFKYVLGILLPFLISFLLVSMLRPAIDKICKKTNASKSFVTVFMVFLTMVGAVALLVLMLIAVANQVGNIFD